MSATAPSPPKHDLQSHWRITTGACVGSHDLSQQKFAVKQKQTLTYYDINANSLMKMSVHTQDQLPNGQQDMQSAGMTSAEQNGEGSDCNCGESNTNTNSMKGTPKTEKENNEDENVPSLNGHQPVLSDAQPNQTPLDIKPKEIFKDIKPDLETSSVEEGEQDTPDKQSKTDIMPDGHPDQTKMTQEQKESYSNSEDGFMDLLGNGQLKKKVVKPGTPNTRPVNGNLVRAKVKMFLENGTCVHDAVDSFFLGENDVIVALDMCAAMMDTGEIATIQTVARFGFGQFGREPDIPGDASLTVEAEILEVLPAPEVSQMSAKELLEMGEKKRLRGNELFSREEYSTAISAYTRAITFFEAGGKLKGEDESLLKQMADGRIKCYNNMAATQLKIGAFQAVIRSCAFVLESEPDNVKALYRLGKAHCGRGEMEKAIGYLKKAIKLEPESKLLHRELSLWTQKRKRETDNEKTMYKKMMGDMADAAAEGKNKSSGSSMMKLSLVVGGLMAAMFSVGFAYYRTAH
ncbi:peptidyl-prolyl cis-trans isomerase FKBP8-like [Babylonia areolata]|uniref:peptidyl-prolyl cis-trans isomerase FKBP8-like n=1 Tax=Babylonia areolata TaxID=304850 RepID=UPI003FD03985